MKKYEDDYAHTLESLLEDIDKQPFRSAHRDSVSKAPPEAKDAQAVPTAQPEVVPDDKLGLEFEDLTYTIVKQEKIDGKWESMNVDLLQGISGKAIRGQLTAIMGPSGAGKSTFLDALAGRIEQRSLGGTVRLDGHKVTGSYIKRNSAYVMQEDHLFPFLTVTETLMFAAEVRLPTTLSRLEKADRVRALVMQLGLEHCAQTYVGDQKRRGISGGEKRRVSIGVDIIHGPALLFLDEPTSGLDSTSALIVVEKLLDIARGRSTILLTIHQPSYRIQMMFGRVIILARGKMVYQGAPDQMAAYIETFGWEVPKNENDIEYFMEIVKEHEQSDTGLDPLVQFQRDGIKTPVTAKSNVRKSAQHTPISKELADEDGGFDHSLTYLRTPRTRELNFAHNFYTGKPFLNVTPGRTPGRTLLSNLTPGFTSEDTYFNLTPGFTPGHTPTSIASSFSPLSVMSKKTAMEAVGEGPQPSTHRYSTGEVQLCGEGWRYENGWLREVMILTWRASKNVLRSPELFVSRELKAVALSILLATLFKDPKFSLDGINQRIGYFVFVLALVLFSCNDALPTFIEERYIFIKETGTKAYRASSYTVASLLVYLPTNALQALTYVVISWWAIKLDGGLGGFFILFLILFALVVTSNSFAVLVSALVPNFVTGYAVVICLTALTFMFCGYFFPRSQMPVYWKWMPYLSTMKYALEASLQNEFVKGKCFSTVPVLPAPGPLRSVTQFIPLPPPNGTKSSDCYLFGKGVVEALDVTEFTIGEGIIFILMWGFIYRVLLYIVLRFYSKSQRK
ncbi:unnamed protein product [Calypogeia fissa]